MTKRKRTNNDVLNTTQKSKDRATRTPLKTGVYFSVLEAQADPAPQEAHVPNILKFWFPGLKFNIPERESHWYKI